MKPCRMLPIHYLLAAALMFGGLSAPGDVAAAFETAQDAVQAGETTVSHGNCHADQTESGTPSSRAGAQNCCGDEQDCTHRGCDCGCLALSLVVPVGETPEAMIRRPAPPASLTAVRERHATSPPIRPPKA